MQEKQYFFWWVKWFLLRFIENWQKTIELRPVSRTTDQVRVGDIVCFNNEVERRVKDIRYYVTLEAALRDENPERIWPGKTRKEILGAVSNL